MERNLTEGNIGKSLILFSLPMIAGNLLQQLYNIVDTLIVGRTIGPAALAAVGSSYAVMVLLTSMVLGLCMGSGVVFAQLYGAGKIREMKVAIFNALLFVCAISLLLFVGAYCLVDPGIRWLRIPEEAVAYTRIYLKIVVIGLLFTSVYNFVASILRSMGNTVMPLVFLGMSAVMNIVLDLVFILYVRMGVAGAAWATVIAQIFSAIAITIYFLAKEKRYCPGRSEAHYDGKLLHRIISNSTLTALQQSIMNFGILMVQGLVNSFGYEASAAFAAVVKIDSFAYMPAQDFGNAFATYVAQNFGAGKWDRIREGVKRAILISGSFCLLASAVVYGFARPLVGIFVDESQYRMIEIGVQYLHIEGAFYIGIGILFLLYALYRGMGRPGMSIVLTMISLGSRVALAYALAAIPSIGLVGIWWAVPIGWALADAFGIICYRKYGKGEISQEL